MHKPQTILFIINPVSGGKAKVAWEEAIKTHFETLPHTIHIYLQTGDGDKQRIQERIAELTPDKVVAVGGDGTVQLVAGIVKESPLLLGILPAGSANGLAKELGIPATPTEAMNIITDGLEGKLDAIRVNEEELCFHLADAGMNALLVHYFEEAGTRGMWGYARSLGKMLWNKKRMRVKIDTDAGEVKRKAYMVVLANAAKYGTGAVINPAGSVSDGVFEVVVVRQLKLSEIIKAVIGRHSFHPKNIETFATTSATISFQRPAHFQVDGEYLGKKATVTARILTGAVNIMLPQPA